MSSSTKVFIYNDGHTTAPNSVADLQTLLSTDEIFGTRPDIQISSFDFSLDGLQQPTFVVPGGQTAMIGKSLKEIFQQIHTSQLRRNYNYIGICAGGFVGTTSSEIFATYDIKTNLNCIPYPNPFFNPPIEFEDLKPKINCNVIQDYAAIGPFHPLSNSLNEPATDFTPYRVKLRIENSTQFLPQLYINGPAFRPIYDDVWIARNLHVVANFIEGTPYKFINRSGITNEYSSLPGIIAARGNNYRGARFLAGTHIEATVKDSRLLSLFWQPGDRSKALSASDMNAFIDEQAETNKTVIDLLAQTFKPR